MARNIDTFLTTPEHDLLDHTGIPGVISSSEFGTGTLGNVTINSLVETSGENHYNTLTVQSGGTLCAAAERKLIIRSRSDITVETGGAIHADGRGFPGGTGGVGGSVTTRATLPTPGVYEGFAHTPSGGSGGGGGSGTVIAASTSTGGLRGIGLNIAGPGFNLVDISSTSVTFTTASDIKSVSLPAGAITGNDDTVEITISGTFQNPGATTNTFTLLLGGQTAAQFAVAVAVGTLDFILKATLYAVSSSSQYCTSIFSIENATYVSNDRRTLSVNTAIAQSLVAQGASTGTSTIVIDCFAVDIRGPVNLGGGAPGAKGNDGSPGGVGSAGGAATTPTTARNRLLDNYGFALRGMSLFGAGGVGGGAGGSGAFLLGGAGAGGSAGAPSSRTGADLGNGGNGGAGVQSSGGPGTGGGGGGGGAGGGHLEIWCGGDLTVQAAARISARGGNGGNGGAGGNASLGGGGGGGGGASGGGGGLVLALYRGSLSNLGSIDTNAGSGGSAGAGSTGPSGSGGAGGAGGAGAAGITITSAI